jgi:hypothetical protein
MKKWLMVILALVLLYGCKEGGSDSNPNPGGNNWEKNPSSDQLCMATTPAGITIVSDRPTLAQYESRWSGELFHWADIDWEVLDEEFKNAKQYYCYTIGWDCKHAEPYQLTVRIKPWDSRCTDVESPLQPKEIYEYINGEWMCVDGWYWKQVVYIHLGDDPGQDHTTIYSEEPMMSQDFKAFQESAYTHELMHFFQEMAGLPFSEIPPQPPHSTVLSGYTVKLPDEEEETESELESNN